MINRRTFVQVSSAAAAAALSGRIGAQESLERLPPENPQAEALKYVEDVEANPPDTYPEGSDQDCANCLHYQAVDDEWGSCAIFPGYRVKAAGWCSAWVKQS